MSYCAVAGRDPHHSAYHDNEYGFPLPDDRALYERLMLEINQAGLSWITILRKREGMRAAYDGFDPVRIAAYGEDDRARLLAEPAVIRNRLKINAAVENARRVLALQGKHGSFRAWLDLHHPRELPDWVKLFRKEFLFTGGEIVREFLVSTGYLPGAHDETCPVHARILQLSPPWAAHS